MDIRQLRYFVRVLELGSFSRAAEVLHVAQPALGMQIRKLEDELHTQLLTRHSRGVEPTAVGTLLRDRAEAILRQVEETRQEIRDASGPARGTVRLATTPATYPHLTIKLIQQSATSLPNIDIVVQEAMNPVLLDSVRAETVDLGLIYLAGAPPDDVMVEHLAEEQAVFVQADPGHRLPSTITLAEVCQHPLVMPGHPHHLRALVQARAEQEGLEFGVRYEISAIGTLLEMVARNLACSVLPFGGVARHLGPGALVARTVVEPELQLTLSLVRSRRRALSKAQVQVRAMLASLVTEERERDALAAAAPLA